MGSAPRLLLPYQCRWAEDRSKVKIVEKARRIGITYGEAADCVLDAAIDGGSDSLYTGYNRKLSEEFVLACREWSQRFNFICSELEEGEIVDEERRILTHSITFNSGKRIMGMSSRPSNLRGFQGRVIIDEAAFHEDLREMLKAAIALLIRGGRVHIISTHNGAENAFNQILSDCREGREPYSVHRYTFDEAIAEGLYRQICLLNREEWTEEKERAFAEEIRHFYGESASEELDVIPSKGSGVYMSGSLIESAMRPENIVIEGLFSEDGEQSRRSAHDIIEQIRSAIFSMPKGFDSVIGVDFGRVSNLTSIAVVRLRGGMIRHCPIIVELEKCQFRHQKEIIRFIMDNLPEFQGGNFDRGGMGLPLVEELADQYGPEVVTGIAITENWYLEVMPQLKSMFIEGMIELPSNPNIRSDFMAIRQYGRVPKIKSPTTRSENKGQKRHGDSGIAVGLGAQRIGFPGQEEMLWTRGSLSSRKIARRTRRW